MGEYGPDPLGRNATPFKYGRTLSSGKIAGSKGASEYGGVEGMIQPAPHDVNEAPDEILRLVYNTDPGTRVETPIDGLDDLPLMRGYLD